MERGAYTFLSNVIVSFAFSLMLVAIAAIDDVHVSMRSGLQRGAAGWTIFVALPSAGLPPELPGMAGADLTSRQLWWLYAVFFGALGFLIALLASRLPEPRRAASAEKVVTFYQLRGESLRYWIIQLTAIVLACVVAAIPHMSGAPHPSLSHEPVNTTVTCGASHEECAKAGPGPELAATYAVWCLATAFLYWLCLGVSLCFTYNLLMCFEAPLLPELSIRPVGPKYEPKYDLADSRFSRDSAEESRSVMNGADAL
jgi:predicted cobalt transporter CbtA